MQAYLEKNREIINSFSINTFSNNFHAHWHINVEIIYVLKGTITIGVNEQKATLQQGDLVVCCSNEIHYYENNSSVGLLCIFHPDLIGFPTGWPNGMHFQNAFYRHNELSPALKSTLIDISKMNGYNSSNTGEADLMLVKSILYKLCGLLQKKPEYTTNDILSNQKLANRQRVQKAIEYIEYNYTEQISLKKITKQLNISPYYLSHMFKSMIGVTIPHYVNLIRIRNAENDIINSDKTFVEIALEHGFGTVRSFNRAYKLHKGCTPSEKRY